MLYTYKIIVSNYPTDPYCTSLNEACADGWELVEWRESYFLVRKKEQPVQEPAAKQQPAP
jgi:hypothetical protein